MGEPANTENQGTNGLKECPLVTIITPSYNQGPYIEETIQSVLNQDYPRIEHIVVDGGSTDETLSVLKRYPHLKWVSEPDRGQSHAINKGFQIARGEIIAWLNSDDTYLPGAVKAAVEALEKSKGRYIVMGECPFIDKDGNLTGDYHPSTYRARRNLIKIWKGLHSIPQPTVFFFKELLDEFGGLDESLYFAMDYDLWLRFSKRYPFFSIGKPLATYRIHQTSKSLEISEQELLKRTVEISRRYWGPNNSPSYWYYNLSYRLSQIFLWQASNRLWNRSVSAYYEKKWIPCAFHLLVSIVVYPPILLRKRFVFSYFFRRYFSPWMDHRTEYAQKLKADHDFFVSELSTNGEALVKHYLAYFKIVPEAYIRRCLSHAKRDLIHNPLATRYIESQLGAPMRMLDLIGMLKDHGYEVSGKSILDIGCSNGALLLACRGYGASNLVGIDVNEGRLNNARQLIGEKNITVINLDILSSDVPPPYGPFDIIFATDVIEHISNPPLFFAKIKGLLSSTGSSFAFLSVFNRFNFQNIKSEPHYNVPGMILLEHDAAKKLWYEVRSAMHSALEYEVGHWYSFEEYAAMAEGVGLELTVFGKGDFKVMTRDYKKAISEFRREVREMIERSSACEESKQLLHTALEVYCNMYDDDHRRYTTGTLDKSVLYNKYYRQPIFMRCGHKRALMKRR
jgi:glycosyltransferase involved in cell wall biosynthesis/2-polyprenyl-3-methyl-5-hydroxy-6-metoxy-1,4-benzoquinol methylase